MTKIVRKTLCDRPMTAVQKRRLDKLAQQPDSEIDYSDIQSRLNALPRHIMVQDLEAKRKRG